MNVWTQLERHRVIELVLADRFKAVMALHTPCHSAERDGLDCTRYFQHAGVGLCTHCRDQAWPCPTVLALTTDPQETPPS